MIKEVRITALINGITGQDGSYLDELLLNKGYEVNEIKRRSSCFNTARIEHAYQDLQDFYYQEIEEMIEKNKNIALKDSFLKKEFPKINKN